MNLIDFDKIRLIAFLARVKNTEYMKFTNKSFPDNVYFITKKDMIVYDNNDNIVDDWNSESLNKIRNYIDNGLVTGWKIISDPDEPDGSTISHLRFNDPLIQSFLKGLYSSEIIASKTITSRKDFEDYKCKMHAIIRDILQISNMFTYELSDNGKSIDICVFPTKPYDTTEIFSDDKYKR